MNALAAWPTAGPQAYRCPCLAARRRAGPSPQYGRRGGSGSTCAPPVAAAASFSVALHPESPILGGPAGGGRQQKVRRIILLRHADSDGSDVAGLPVRDHDRPISDQGRQEANVVALMLKGKGWLPDLVLASNSTRTKQTLDQMAGVVQELSDVDAHFYGSLYTVAALDGQTREHLHECLLEVVDDDRNQVVMCVGHNKGWEEAASSFCGQAVKLRTASAALLQAYADSWCDVLKDKVQWQLVEVLSPAM